MRKSSNGVLERGATYYFADGEYPSYVFDVTEEGDSVITIKKATIADHGTDIGWDNSYGDGQAVFQPLLIYTGYWVIDGSHRDSKNSGHGFKIVIPGDKEGIPENCIKVVGPTISTRVNNITIRYVEFTSAIGEYPQGKQYTVKNGYEHTNGGDNVYIGYCYFHHFTGTMQRTRQMTGFIVEHNYYDDNKNYPDGPHGDAIQLWGANATDESFPSSNCVIRYNEFSDIEGTGFINLAWGIDNIRIYGNVFNFTKDNDKAGCWIAYIYKGKVGSVFIYNNTILNGNFVQDNKGYSTFYIAESAIPQGKEQYNYNNLWFNCRKAGVYGFESSGYHYISQSTLSPAYPVENTTVQTDADPFADREGYDYRLAAETQGKVLTSEAWWDPQYDSIKDMNGATRGEDGVWDIGAFEFVDTIIPTPTPTATPTPTQTSVTYYVDYESGNDNNDDLSPNTAWKHAPIDLNAGGKAFTAVLSPGDTILFRSNVVYRGNLVAGSIQGRRNLGMGIEGNPITLKGDGWGEGKAIIDGSEPLTGWVKCRSSAECGGNENWANIWVTAVPSEWRTGTNRAITLNTYQGEKMMSVAQYPDQPNIFYFDDTDYFAVSDNYTESWLEDDALARMSLTGSYLVLWGGNNNALIRTPTSFDPLTNRVTYEEIINPYGKYSILNSIDSEVFNRPGEFYYDETSGKLYVWPLDDADPTKGEITISVQSNGIEFWSGNDYVAVEGFIVQKYIGRGITWSQSPVANGCIIRNNVIRYCRNVDTTNSIHVGAMMNALVEGNEVYRNAGPLRGIACLGGSGHIVRNNTVRESGRTGIYFTSVSNGMILNNTVIDNTGKHSNGISVYGNSSDVLVAGNQVYNSNIAYTMEQSKDIYLFNNIFIGSHGNTGISVWSGMNGMHLYHNLIGGWYLGSASNNVNTANNIIIGTGTSPETENMDLFLKAKPATDMTTLFYRSPVVSSLLADVNKYDSVTNISTVYLVDEGYENIIAPGYYLRYDQSTVHQITSVSRVIYKGNWRVKVELSTPIVAVKKDAYVEVWKGNDDFTIDYHLFDGSIAVDKGMDLSGVIPFEKFPLYDFSKDFDDSPRVGKWDIGPYEYLSD